MSNTHNTFERSADVLSTESANETLLLRPSLGRYYGLGQVGTYIWSRLEQPTTQQNLASLVASEFGVAVQTAQNDVHAFLDQLQNEGLIQASNATPAAALTVVSPAAREYSAPRLEVGNLRQAASGNSGVLDGGVTESGGIGGLGS